MLFKFIHTLQIPGSATVFQAGSLVDSAKIHPGYLQGWLKSGFVLPHAAAPSPIAAGSAEGNHANEEAAAPHGN